MLVQVCGRILQILHAESAYGLHDVGPNTFEGRVSATAAVRRFSRGAHVRPGRSTK